jgi:hypothetical protein
MAGQPEGVKVRCAFNGRDNSRPNVAGDLHRVFPARVPYARRAGRGYHEVTRADVRLGEVERRAAPVDIPHRERSAVLPLQGRGGCIQLPELSSSTSMLIDEATQFLRSQYRYLRTRNRATRDSVIPFMALASNPGNVGHLWAQAEFIDPGPPEQVHEVEVEPGVFEKHLFIPAFLSDNIILEQRDPGYRARLEAQPEIVRRQLLDGDWSVFAGQYFKEWRPDIHVVEPFTIPHWWKRFRSLDYGLDCTACYWWAVDQSGRCYIYRELYQPDLILSGGCQAHQRANAGARAHRLHCGKP